MVCKNNGLSNDSWRFEVATKVWIKVQNICLEYTLINVCQFNIVSQWISRFKSNFWVLTPLRWGTVLNYYVYCIYNILQTIASSLQFAMPNWQLIFPGNITVTSFLIYDITWSTHLRRWSSTVVVRRERKGIGECSFGWETLSSAYSDDSFSCLTTTAGSSSEGEWGGVGRGDGVVSSLLVGDDGGDKPRRVLSSVFSLSRDEARNFRSLFSLTSFRFYKSKAIVGRCWGFICVGAVQMSNLI